MSTGATIMVIPTNLSRLLEKHVVLDVRGIDRIYLNAYQPLLQIEGSVRNFFCKHRGQTFASSALMAPITAEFVKAIEGFAKAEGLDIYEFRNGERKDDIANIWRRTFKKPEGVVLIGKAQEKTSAFRTHKKKDPKTGKTYPWLYRTSVRCNQYYFYIEDEDFGPLFMKFSSYFPYTGRVCLNGHEYAKRQLTKEGIAFEELDNGFLSCANPERLQQILDGLTPDKIEAVFRKWLARLPHPFTPADRAAGYRYQLSILQIELARTQVFTQPVAGRQFFEQLIRENLSLGRPDWVSLIFDRRVTKRTPGTFRTRILTQGVIPSLHVSYKSSKIKQYFKEGRALRTETTINNTRDFGVGKSLHNLPALREIGFSANQRLLDVQRLSHDCLIGQERFERVNQPIVVDGQRAAALRFGDPRTMGLLTALCLFVLLPRGFSNRMLRDKVAMLMGCAPTAYGPGRMTYDLRRLKLHGLIERIAATNRYRVTTEGVRIATFFSKLHTRLLRTGCSDPLESMADGQERIVTKILGQLHEAVEALCQQAQMAA
jgi:hypothetical protein